MSKVIHKLYAYFLLGRPYGYYVSDIPIEEQIYLESISEYVHYTATSNYVEPYVMKSINWTKEKACFRRVENE